jgi:hypothetical protein
VGLLLASGVLGGCKTVDLVVVKKGGGAERSATDSGLTGDGTGSGAGGADGGGAGSGGDGSDGSGAGSDDGGSDDGGSDDGGSDDGGSDDGTELPPEAECGDGLDNDEDGSTDCADPDCAEVAPCWWPETVVHDGSFDFLGNRVTCETWIGDFDENVDDCTTRYSSTLTAMAEGTGCPVCDRTYSGTLSYSTNSCASVIGGDYPSSAEIGLVFHSPTSWEIYGEADDGSWTSTTLSYSGGTHSFTTAEPIWVDTGDCDNDPLDVGTLTVTWSFRDGG